MTFGAIEAICDALSAAIWGTANAANCVGWMAATWAGVSAAICAAIIAENCSGVRAFSTAKRSPGSWSIAIAAI